ncbi:site-specific integrase [Pseudomonas fluorescens]|uniref:site-specific integrase n=1 Tax=Pseudomonas fluorescens TaxID=294 RepID=UPI0006892E59|nr:site-specific integrase [Pseudomonas fluorescens]
MVLKPSIAPKKVSADDPPAQRYKALKLYNVDLFKRCEESKARGWIQSESQGGTVYPVTCLDHSVQVLASHAVILCPDGSIWKEGALFLLRLALDDDSKDPETLLGMAGHLADFMNTLAGEERHFLDFSGHRFERPTYIYKEKFNLPIKKAQISVSTANAKIRTVVSFYKDLMETRNFTPEQAPWKTKRTAIQYEDSFGYERTKYVTHTDLTFPAIRCNSMGQYIMDGGKLIPLSKDQQQALFEALVETGHPEMLLIFTIALVTGMRIQTILTLRTSSIVTGVRDSFDLIPVRAGRGSLVDAKRDKSQASLMPSWLHYKLNTYLHSKRYKDRAGLALEQDIGAQYIFLSNSGKPYYVGKSDRHRLESNEKGSYIRHFITDQLRPLMLERGCDCIFSFHDLRATFGMNLVEERREMLNRGQINLLQLIDYVRKRMNHSKSETTQEYLNFQQDKEILYQADRDYQEHILRMSTAKV